MPNMIEIQAQVLNLGLDAKKEEAVRKIIEEVTGHKFITMQPGAVYRLKYGTNGERYVMLEEGGLYSLAVLVASSFSSKVGQFARGFNRVSERDAINKIDLDFEFLGFIKNIVA